MLTRLFFLLSFIVLGWGQDDQPVCAVNQLFNGQACVCAPGYFSERDNISKARCEDECEEVYKSLFTYGKCVGKIFENEGKDKQPVCNLRCGVRLNWYTEVAFFVVIAAAIATLVFTLPLCFATCYSCVHAKKASTNSKRVYTETTAAAQAQPSKDQQLAAYQYNPYGYWPYYGRSQ